MQAGKAQADGDGNETPAPMDDLVEVGVFEGAAGKEKPLAVQRVANVERAQMLLESPSRAALQHFLSAWQPLLHATRAAPEHKGLVRWLVDVDPLAI